MCMLILGAEVLGVLGWWLPLGSITKLEQLRTSADGCLVEWRVCLLCSFVLLLLVGGVHVVRFGVRRCEV